MATRQFALLCASLSFVPGTFVRAQSSAQTPGAVPAVTGPRSADSQRSDLLQRLAPLDPSQAARIAASLAVRAVTIVPPSPGANRVDVAVQLQNTCQKAIDAASFTLKAEYADGTEAVSSQGFDLLDLYVSTSYLDQALQRTVSLLRPGETYSAKGYVALEKDGSVPVMVEAQVTMIIFEDRTALGYRWEIDRTLNLRAQVAELYAGVVEDLAFVAKSGNVLQALRARRQDLLSGRVAVGARGGPSVLANRAQTLQNLANTLNPADASRLGYEIAKYQALAEAETTHSVLAGGSQ
jgi:hypothetical protein